MKNCKQLLLGLALSVGLVLLGAANGICVTGAAGEQGTGEIHSFTMLPTDNKGWTDFSYMIKGQRLYQDARVIFVSSTEGNNATGALYSINDLTFDEQGQFQAACEGMIKPYQTLAEAAKQLRDGYPDILLLKRGDQWAERFPIGSWPYKSLAGRSETERMVFATYGKNPARPQIRPVGQAMVGYTGTGNLIFSGLHFYAPHKDPKRPEYQSGKQGSAMISFVGGGSDILFEDIHSEYIFWNIQSYDGRSFRNVALRRCFIEKHYNFVGDGHSQGMSIWGLTGFLLEDSVLYHNGWRSDLPKTATTFNRNLYLGEGSSMPVTMRNSFSIMSATDGFQMRSGGIMSGNVLSHNTGNSVRRISTAAPNGIMARVAYNVILATRNGTSGNTSVDQYGAGLQFNSIIEGHALENIIANSIDSKHGMWATDDAPGKGVYSMFRNFTFQRNIVYNHAKSDARNVLVLSATKANSFSNIRLVRNEFVSDNPTSRLIEINANIPASAISLSRENNFWSARADRNWYRIGGVVRNIAGYRSDTKENVGNESIEIEPRYPDPQRSLATYSASLGFGKTLESFVDELRKQQRANWREEFTAPAVVNYIRAGFGRRAMPEGY